MNSPSWESIAPVPSALRGKSSSVKRSVYDRLNREERALFAFYAYCNHSKGSSEEFVRWTRIFFENYWDRELAESARFFKDTEMARLIADVKERIESSANEQERAHLYPIFLTRARRLTAAMDDAIGGKEKKTLHNRS